MNKTQTINPQTGVWYYLPIYRHEEHVGTFPNGVIVKSNKIGWQGTPEPSLWAVISDSDNQGTPFAMWDAYECQFADWFNRPSKFSFEKACALPIDIAETISGVYSLFLLKPLSFKCDRDALDNVSKWITKYRGLVRAR